MDIKEYADLLLKTEHDYNYYENLYPKRDLKEGAIVSRYAPSPTGFVHLGALYTAFINMKLAKQSGGVSFLRIEDTDQKRSIDDGTFKIIKDLSNFGISFDEGVTLSGDKGAYGPYTQSERMDIYKAFAKKLIMEDKAYPCFCDEESLKTDRERQERNKERIGYYGFYARCRKLSRDEVLEKINNGEKYIIRLKSRGNFNNRFKIKDEIKGKMELPENDQDIVIIKSDGLPTYHFAHAVDDHLMGTTHVIRGDEWLSSLPVHVQLFEYLGFDVPKYAHLSTIMKVDENGVKRKLSKRKDPEAAISYYHEMGIPNKAVMLYLETVANSNFEMWLLQNKDANPDDFALDFKKMPSSGSLFDYDKLINISKNYISTLSAPLVYDMALKHASIYDKDFALLLEKYKDYSISIFNIEREQKKPRKDIAYFSDVKSQVWYMYDELFEPTTYEWQGINDKVLIKDILSKYLSVYSEDDDKNTWFNKMKDVALSLGYVDIKTYKENPDLYKGNITDFSTVIRVAITSKCMTPDLFEIMRILGKDRIMKRVNSFLN